MRSFFPGLAQLASLGIFVFRGIMANSGTCLVIGLIVGLLCGCDKPDSSTPSKSRAPVSAATARTITGTGGQSPPAESQIARYFRNRKLRASSSVGSAAGQPTFRDIAATAGIDHRYLTGATGQLLMVEPVGGGCGWLDFDRDGAWDLYLNQGGPPTADSSAARPSDQLYRNLGSARFAPVTDPAGINERSYSQGVAIGDYDNDGFDDILVTNIGPDVLYRNQGDGTFVDVTATTIGADRFWGISAAWGDIDLDGDLDLYVGNYVNFDPNHPQICRNASGVQVMCQPNQVDPVPDECFLNEGDGTFRPVAQERGLTGASNRAMGVVIADFTNDGWPDIWVANDATPNFLFVNQGNGHFQDQAPLLGCAVAADGRAQANMGIALGDFDHNGWLDTYITHFEGEWNTLYQNLGPAGFQDVSALLGLVPRKLSLVGFGTVMHDFDQNGQEDLFVANGHLDDPGHLGVPVEMPPLCYSFDGARWQDTSATAGEYFQGHYVGRGVATADFDNDGDLDLAVVHQNAPLALLQNDSRRGHWLKLEFVGRVSNRNGIGVRVTVRQGEMIRLQELAGGTSYAAAHQSTLVFGLGDHADPCQVEIRWPNGQVQTLPDLAADSSHSVREPLPAGTDSHER